MAELISIDPEIQEAEELAARRQRLAEDDSKVVYLFESRIEINQPLEAA